MLYSIVFAYSTENDAFLKTRQLLALFMASPGKCEIISAFMSSIQLLGPLQLGEKIAT